MSPHSTVIFAAAFGALGAILLAVLIWRLLVFRRRRVQRSADVITARPFLVPTSSSGSSSSSASTPWGDPSSPSPPTSATFPGMREKAERRDHALVASLSNFGLLQPLRRPSTHASTAAPRYSVAATAPDSPDTPWPPEGEGAASGRPRTRRSTEKRSRRLFVASPVPTLPSARVPRRDRYDLVAEGMGDAPIMPPPYRFLDLH
ncbi:hypothetical protein TRAPUB_1907 [Trametes pubescens]|uniref:Uncharacterized protein n=1 Tax=Trametes pubescens TaxID=154538 RepID=A0A1M2VI23_TRAPU|nr:hypothetical protein TRAPUB_1907 [Trametes pubescens]